MKRNERNAMIATLVNFWREHADSEYIAYIREYAGGKSLYWAGDELEAAGVGNYIDDAGEGREIVKTAAILYLNS